MNIRLELLILLRLLLWFKCIVIITSKRHFVIMICYVWNCDWLCGNDICEVVIKKMKWNDKITNYPQRKLDEIKS